ncbi:MAG: hypothetical protein ACM33T_10970 [Solirubrobacterales bacterium]
MPQANTRRAGAGCALLIALGLAPYQAGAADLAGIPVFGKVTTKIENDYSLREGSGSDKTRGNNLYAEIEPELTIKPTANLAIEMGAKLEQVQDRQVGDYQYFAHEGAYISTLQAVYDLGGVAFNAGKFTAPFGFAPDDAVGLFGDTFMEDYELTERLGGGVATELPIKGVATVGMAVSAFTRDRTSLSRTALTMRPVLSRHDGGPGNTEGPASWSAVVDVDKIAAVPDLHLKASYLSQTAGENDPKDQRAWGLGFEYAKAFEAGFSVRPMAEYVRSHGGSGFNEATGGLGVAEDILTAGVGVGYDRWNASLAWGQRHIEAAGQASADDTFWQVGLGYAFVEGFAIDAAYGYLEEAGVPSRTVGIRLKHAFEF